MPVQFSSVTVFHGPAPRSPLHRLAVRLRHSRSNTSTEYSLPEHAITVSTLSRRNLGRTAKEGFCDSRDRVWRSGVDHDDSIVQATTSTTVRSTGNTEVKLMLGGRAVPCTAVWGFVHGLRKAGGESRSTDYALFTERDGLCWSMYAARA